ARHGQAAVARLVAPSSSRRTPLASMIRSALSRSCCPRLARYSATQPSALLRRDSNEVSILSSNSRTEDDFPIASASMAVSSSSKRLSLRLDLSFKSIAQSIKFISRFTNKQRQFRQKCQLVSSTHLIDSSERIRGPGVG